MEEQNPKLCSCMREKYNLPINNKKSKLPPAPLKNAWQAENISHALEEFYMAKAG